MDEYNMDSDLTIESLAIRSILSTKTLYNPMRVPCSDKEKDFEEEYVDASAAFLGPNLWDKSAEFKMDYLDLDAILNGSSEYDQQKSTADSGVAASDKVNPLLPTQEIPNMGQDISSVDSGQLTQLNPASPLDSSSISSDVQSDSEKKFYSPDCDRVQYAVDCKFSPRDLALATPPGHEHYDPAATRFPDEELKPQPIIKKSRKNFVPDKLKDDKYWARRHKNNIAARRSREARRLKENQIVLRASYLEKENSLLKEDVLRLRAENDLLKSQLQKYQS